jgi:DNA-binding MarR family transcriptional regulator
VKNDDHLHAVRLSTASGRAALPANAKPYWEQVQPGIYLGFYKGARTSTWYARRFVGDGKYRQVRLGPSRDSEHKGATGLSYDDALQALSEWSARAAVSAPKARHAAMVDTADPLEPSRLDKISAAWAAERPDIDFWLAGFFLRLEYAHVMHERRVAELSAEYGLNAGDLHVLLALRRNGTANAMRPTELFRELLVTSGAITKRLDRLAAGKLIERVAAADDRRSELVRLTAAGRKVADAAMSRISDTLAALVERSGLTKEQLRAADAVFRRLLSHM